MVVVADYERPGVRTQQTFEEPSPTPAGTAFFPVCVAPSFQILSREVIGEDVNNTGYDGTQSDYGVPFETDAVVDEDEMQVLFRYDDELYLVNPDKWDYDQDAGLLRVDGDIEIDADGDGQVEKEFAQNDQADVLVNAIAMRKTLKSDINEDDYYIQINNVDQLEEEVGKITPENPLAWGLFWQLTSTDTPVTGMLVAPSRDDDAMQEINGDFHHYLSLDQWVEALGRLEPENVYNVVPTYPSDRYFNDELKPSIIAQFTQHVKEMSQPDNKRESITTHVNPAWDDDIEDRDAQAENLMEFAESYDTRRLSLTVPREVEVPVNGSLRWVSGEVLCNIIAGMDAFYRPSQPYTRLPMPAGINRMRGSDDLFTPRQLDVIAAGGNYIIVQEEEGAPPYSRHQQTTNTDFIEKNERSIVKAVDYTAKSLRANLERFIGRFNITNDLLASIRTSVQGTLRRLQNANIIRAGNIRTLEQKDIEKDEIRLVVDITVLYPNNNIDVEIVV